MIITKLLLNINLVGYRFRGRACWWRNTTECARHKTSTRIVATGYCPCHERRPSRFAFDPVCGDTLDTAIVVIRYDDTSTNILLYTFDVWKFETRSTLIIIRTVRTTPRRTRRTACAASVPRRFRVDYIYILLIRSFVRVRPLTISKKKKHTYYYSVITRVSLWSHSPSVTRLVNYCNVLARSRSVRAYSHGIITRVRQTVFDNEKTRVRFPSNYRKFYFFPYHAFEVRSGRWFRKIRSQTISKTISLGKNIWVSFFSTTRARIFRLPRVYNTILQELRFNYLQKKKKFTSTFFRIISCTLHKYVLKILLKLCVCFFSKTCISMLTEKNK